jgi:hypothetical protein
MRTSVSPWPQAAEQQEEAEEGREVQVDPMNPKLRPPGSKRLKLNCDVLLSTSAFKFKLRRYTKKKGGDYDYKEKPVVGRCRLTAIVTRHPISIWEMTISILSSAISLAHIPHRYLG